MRRAPRPLPLQCSLRPSRPKPRPRASCRSPSMMAWSHSFGGHLPIRPSVSHSRRLFELDCMFCDGHCLGAGTLPLGRGSSPKQCCCFFRVANLPKHPSLRLETYITPTVAAYRFGNNSEGALSLACVLLWVVPVSGIFDVILIAVVCMLLSLLLTRLPELVWALVMPPLRHFVPSCIAIVTVSAALAIVFGILAHTLITSRPPMTLACVSPAAFA